MSNIGQWLIEIDTDNGKTRENFKKAFTEICEDLGFLKEAGLIKVVRCQNCKYYCGEETYTNHRICKMWEQETFANGWCYMGERREQNDD